MEFGTAMTMARSIWQRTSQSLLLFSYHQKTPLQTLCCSASWSSYLDTTARLLLLDAGIARLHKSTFIQATSPVLACGSCLPGMVSLAGVARKPSPWLQRAQQPAFVGSPFSLVMSTVMYTVVHAAKGPPTSQMISPRLQRSSQIARPPYKQL